MLNPNLLRKLILHIHVMKRTQYRFFFKIYKAVRSKIEYAAVIYGNAKESILETLESINHSALII